MEASTVHIVKNSSRTDCGVRKPIFDGAGHTFAAYYTETPLRVWITELPVLAVPAASLKTARPPAICAQKRILLSTYRRSRRIGKPGPSVGAICQLNRR